MCVIGKIVSFDPVVYYNKVYLGFIGVVAFITQLQLLHLLRYHRTISILGETLCRSMTDLLSFGCVMGIIFIAFAIAIHLLYHDLVEYSTIGDTMGSQVRIEHCIFNDTSCETHHTRDTRSRLGWGNQRLGLISVSRD